ncbi:outer membrane lipoprotein-sorting protein [bacterium]|nr:outer membrane lipoprotein-sorting protein [bacterium]
MPFFPQVLPAQEMTGEAIIQKVNDLMNPSSTQAKIEMIVHGKGDKKRTFVYNSWSMDEGEKNLVRYIQPRRLKGQATLMLNHADDIWMYFARTKRVRKLASHAKKQKMEGSDFSYEDMGSGDSFLTDYQARRLDDDRINDLDCYQVALLKKQGSDVGYSKIILWVVQENFVPIRMDYYDEDQPERVYKRLIQSDIRMIDDIPTAMHMIMENLNDGTSTEITFREINYNMDLSASMFTERGLRQ